MLTLRKEAFEIMLQGLIDTAVEKMCVLGKKEAKGDVLRILRMIRDLETFWNSDCELSEIDFSLKARATLSKHR